MTSNDHVMSDNEFLSREDLNPLFQIRGLKTLLEQICNVLGPEHSLSQADVDLIGKKVQLIEVVLGYLLEYIQELANVNKSLLVTFDAALTDLKLTCRDDDDADDNNDTGDDRVLSRLERNKLQQHIPGFQTPDPDEPDDTETRDMIRNMRPQLCGLKRHLVRVVEEAYRGRQRTGLVMQTVDVMDEGIKQGKRSQEEATEDSQTKQQQKKKKTSARQETSPSREQQDKVKKPKSSKHESAQPKQESKPPKNEPKPAKPESKPVKQESLKRAKQDKKEEKSSHAKSGSPHSSPEHKPASPKRNSPAKKNQVPPRSVTPGLHQENLLQSPEPAIEEVARSNEEHLNELLEKEEERRKEEEAEKKKEEMAELLREEREKRRLLFEEEKMKYEDRKNTDNWPSIRFTVPSEDSLLSSDHGCTLHSPEGTQTDRLQCSLRPVVVDAGPKEPLTSSVVCLATNDGEPIRFEFPALVSVPYQPVPGREPVVYVKEGRGQWTPVPTRALQVQEEQVAQFERRALQHLSFAVKITSVSRHDVSSASIVITSPDDPSVRVRVPENTFTSGGQIHLKVTDQSTVYTTRSRLSNTDMLDDVSALCHVHVDGDRAGSVYVETGFNTDSDLPTLLPPGHKVHIMTSTNAIHWQRSEPISTEYPDRFMTELCQDENSVWVLLIRTKGFSNPRETPSLASDVMASLISLPVHVILYQHRDQPETVHIQSCGPQTLPALIDKLAERGFDDGVVELVHVPDGSHFHVRASTEGNIDFTDDVTSSLVTKHVSCLDTGELAAPVTIKVKNRYIQKNHAVYRGRIRVYSVTSRITGYGATSQDTETFLCEMPVTLPKSPEPEEEEPKLIPQRPTFVGSEPLTEQYLRHLGTELDEEWPHVALGLGLSGPTIQRVVNRWHDHDEAKFELLTIWYRRSRKNIDKVAHLQTVLTEAGRADLVEDLKQKHDFIMQDKRLKNKEQLVSLLARRVATDPRALDDWKNILRALRVDDSTIADIEDRRSPVNRIYCLQQGLVHWLHLASNDSNNPQMVCRTLKKLGHVAAADQVALCLGTKNK